jgi:hypothetical protein
MLDPSIYPILSRAEGLDHAGMKAFSDSLTEEEKVQASKEADKLIGVLSTALDPFIKTIMQAVESLVPVIQRWYDALPQEIKDELTSKKEE